MKRFVLYFLFLAVIAGGLLSFSPKVEAFYPLDFGGRVVFLFPCVNGLWTTVAVPQMVTPIPPVATFIPTMYFYVPGSSLRLYGPPTQLGQAVLGKAFGFMLCFVPCPFGLCPIGGGFLVSPVAGSSPKIPQIDTSPGAVDQSPLPGQGGYNPPVGALETNV